MSRNILVADPKAIPKLKAVEEEVRAGLPASQARINEAQENEDYYQLHNERHLEKRGEAESPDDFYRKPKRFSRLLRCVTRKLSQPIYPPGPTRQWEGDQSIHEWYEGVARDIDLNVRMKQADRASTLNHVAALQVEATGDPERPLRAWLWKGHEFEVHFLPDDPLTPWAVTTIERIPDGLGRFRTRYRTWSAYERTTWLTAPFDLTTTAGGRRADVAVPEESGASPYPGVLPFVFIRNEPPESDFWAGGIGTALAQTNRELDRGLTDLAQHVRIFLNPISWARNVSVSSQFFDRVGQFIHLRADPSIKAGDQKGVPELGYLQAQLAVEAAWLDLKTYADQSLEELEVPLTVVRSDASTDLSGVAIVAKSLPLQDRTKERQVEMTEAETEFAATALAVAGQWYGLPGFVAAAADPKLSVIWPEPRIPLPTPERNQADDWELERGLSDPIEVLARRRGLTLMQATELAAEIAKRRQVWTDLMASPMPEEGGEDEASDDESGEDPDVPDEDENDGREDRQDRGPGAAGPADSASRAPGSPGGGGPAD